MKSPLHVLHLEDDPNDATLVQRALQKEGIACDTVCVENQVDFMAALQRGGVDLVLSDFSLPTFDGLAAAKIVRKQWPDIPLILVSGTLGEESAIDSMKSGATDYVLKDRLGRLGPAVRRAMQEVEDHEGTRRAEVALRDSEELFHIIFNESPLGVALVGMDGHPVLTNAALQKMLGYSDEELKAMHFDDFTHPDDRAIDNQLYQELVQGRRHDYKMEKRYLRKDGVVVWAHLSVRATPAGKPHAGFSIGMVEDVTERRSLEAQFIEAQKMEVVGQLAGGIAHDFNNILAVIMGYADLTMQSLGADHPQRSYLETIRSAAERAAGLTRQLLIFSRKQAVQLVVLDLNRVVEDMDKMLRRLVDENIEMTIIFGRGIGHVKADSGYVGQVVMNLVVNARDAMPNGGKLTIATSNIKIGKEDVRARSGIVEGDYVLITVSDTGTGMTAEVKSRLFEAFFTTKPKGKGTGLGLATCQSIVEQSGGHISVESEEGQGTTFRVYFPRVYESLERSTEFFEKGPIPRGTETLLLVEDDPSVRHLASSILESQGYHVLRANNGQEGLRVARDCKGEAIRLVITDVIMPQMGGKVMAEWLKATYPDIKILFTSGYTDDAIAHHGVLDRGVAFLPKPYAPSTLARRVREMLDAK